MAAQNDNQGNLNQVGTPDAQSVIPVYKVPVNQLREGMIVAENIFKTVPHDDALIPQGVALTAEHIKKLNESEHARVLVEPPPRIKALMRREWTRPSVPLKKPPPRMPVKQQQPQALGGFHNTRVLIVEDMQQMRQTMKDMMQQLGAKEVDMAPDGSVAIDKISFRNYHIILCDHNLGIDKKSGLEVFEELRYKGVIGPSTIFVVVTGEDIREIKMSFMDDMPDDFIEKPFTKEILRVRLLKLIERKRCLIPIDEAILAKDIPKALAYCDQQIKENPRNAYEIMKVKTNLYMRNKNFQDAKALFEKVLKVRSDVLWAKLGLGKVHYYEKNYAIASEVFQELLNNYPNFIQAYDWLAKTLEKLGFLDDAQEIYQNAVKLSPQAVKRQKNLADIAFKNKNFAVAEKSYRSAVKLGKTSIFKDVKTYTGLAKSLAKNKSDGDALSIIKEAKKIYRGDESANFEISVSEGVVHNEAGRAEAAKAALVAAEKIVSKMGSGNDLGAETTIELAEAHLLFGDHEKGMKLVEELASNFCEDNDVMDSIEEVFINTSMVDDGLKMMQKVKQRFADMNKRFADMNNTGIELFKAGKIEEALDHFRKAADQLPNNKPTLGNYAQALIMYMQQNGTDERLLYQCKQVLERLNVLDSSYRKFHTLMKMYRKLIQGQ